MLGRRFERRNIGEGKQSVAANGAAAIGADVVCCPCVPRRRVRRRRMLVVFTLWASS